MPPALAANLAAIAGVDGPWRSTLGAATRLDGEGRVGLRRQRGEVGRLAGGNEQRQDIRIDPGPSLPCSLMSLPGRMIQREQTPLDAT